MILICALTLAIYSQVRCATEKSSAEDAQAGADPGIRITWYKANGCKSQDRVGSNQLEETKGFGRIEQSLPSGTQSLGVERFGSDEL
ncbi:hypothetical protein WJX73_009456 [Symbiochloris irregularis]|uniref:Secreted protein n=1 Tax=Symbiochloris irregularis TaxID=706552 RepID=A0AAW1NR04_9CHLO